MVVEGESGNGVHLVVTEKVLSFNDDALLFTCECMNLNVSTFEFDVKAHVVIGVVYDLSGFEELWHF